ncbi:hypothetical protein BGZ61DRAFT_542644 [Ilyonectria robusta]|uniref:uncharacterized protein n=1 Tax=Ilyonectria robusta TaxID=1079257 RepID=UPI001E8DDD4B|nr:uncharacterized protein BGZ61DRAFT_542644 [Ilyonectria robusta]KAH8646030.1 hypothetical protein BGZ61DRAFT_542644 [Ilyonectria robusta]
MADVFGIVAGLLSVAALFNCVNCFEYMGRDCERCQLTGFPKPKPNDEDPDEASDDIKDRTKDEPKAEPRSDQKNETKNEEKQEAKKDETNHSNCKCPTQ